MYSVWVVQHILVKLASIFWYGYPLYSDQAGLQILVKLLSIILDRIATTFYLVRTATM
jgi:hypothetical protein